MVLDEARWEAPEPNRFTGRLVGLASDGPSSVWALSDLGEIGRCELHDDTDGDEFGPPGSNLLASCPGAIELIADSPGRRLYVRRGDGALGFFDLHDLGDDAASVPFRVIGAGWASVACLVSVSSERVLYVDRDGSLREVLISSGAVVPSQSALLGRGWDRYTRLFSSPARLLAEGATGELSIFDLERFADGGDPVGAAVLCGGWQSFTALTTAGPTDDQLVAINGSGDLMLFGLEPAFDSAGEPAHEVVLLSSAANVCPPSFSAYCWPLATTSGGQIGVHFASASEISMEIFDSISGVRMSSPDLPVSSVPASPQLEPAERWSPSVTFTVPDDWASSLYHVRLTDPSGRSTTANFTVSPADAEHKKLVVMASPMTWNAYNSWGGVSKYGPAFRRDLSLKRPSRVADPIWDGEPNHLVTSDTWLLSTISALGFSFDVVTDIQVDDGFEVTRDSTLVLLTHPEYWTVGMRIWLDGFVAEGGSLIYLGGNGLFEVVERDPADPEVVTYFPRSDPPDRAPNYFRNLSPPMPERELLGVGFRYDVDWKADPSGHVAGPYVVEEPDHWAFEGCDLGPYNRIGMRGLNGGGACGWEMDTSEAGRAPAGIVAARGALGDRGRPPADVVVLARGVQADSPGGSYGCDMTIRELASGAIVFSVGSLCFAGSVVLDTELQGVLGNVLSRCLGPEHGHYS